MWTATAIGRAGTTAGEIVITGAKATVPASANTTPGPRHIRAETLTVSPPRRYIGTG